MKRRAFLGVLGSAAAAWPLAARAQPRERVRRVGILLPAAADQPVFQRRVEAFLQALGQSGWNIGHNLQIDVRWATHIDAALRRHAAELAALAPDVILVHGTSTVAPLLQATRTVPIVFTALSDPVASGFVDSLARPGGNATGFMNFEFSLSGKWLELLKQIAPDVTRVAVLRDPAIASGIGQFSAIQSAAPSLRMDVSPVVRRRRRDRTCSRGRRALRKWRSDRGGERVGAASSRSDHYAGGPTQAARSLLRTLLRRRRRLGLLWG